MTSAELEKLIEHYKDKQERHYDSFRADIVEQLEAELKRRANNGTYHVIPTFTGRHHQDFADLMRN